MVGKLRVKDLPQEISSLQSLDENILDFVLNSLATFPRGIKEGPFNL